MPLRNRVALSFVLTTLAATSATGREAGTTPRDRQFMFSVSALPTTERHASVAAGRALASWRIDGNALVEKPYSAGRDPIDLITAFGASRRPRDAQRTCQRSHARAAVLERQQRGVLGARDCQL
jgi:hypothetical protein